MIKHSSKVRNGLNSHLRQSQVEHAQSNPNAQYIIAAEFDNKSGPVIKHQFPKTIPGFKAINNDSKCSNLASLMIPNSVENHPGKPDFTVFVLYKNQSTYQMFPVSKLQKHSLKVDPSLIIEEEDCEEEDTANGVRKKASSYNHPYPVKETEEPLFFISVVNTLLDKTNDRGAIIKAIALGTPMSNFYIFKPLLIMVLDLYMNSNNDVKILIDCFNMINSLDLSLVTRFHSNTVLQNILNSINDEDITSKIFDSKDSSLSNILKVNELPKKDKFGNTIKFKNRILEYRFSTFTPKVLPSYFTKIPLHIDLIKYDPIKIETNYNNVILKLLLKIIPFISEMKDSEYSWRIIINSTKSSKDELCQFVLALSNLINGFSSNHFENTSICVFPYMEISILDMFRVQFSKELKRDRFFYIIGVSNPIFEYQTDAWDFYYDLDIDSLLTSETSIPLNGNSVKNQKIRSMFNKYSGSQEQLNPVINQSTNKKGLMLKVIDLLVKGQHDNETVLNTLKRASILQLIHLINDEGSKEPTDVEMVLKDQYILNYKDLIFFPEIFNYNSLKVLKLIYELESDLTRLLWGNSSHVNQNKRKMLQSLYKNLKQLYKFVAINKKNLGKFLNIALNYPLVSVFEGVDIAGSKLAELDIEKLLLNERSSMRSIDSLCDCNSNDSTIDHFNTYKSFNLFLFPLFLTPYMEQDDSHYLSDMGPPGSFSRPSTSRNYHNYQSDSSLSMISSVYETNDTMSHEYKYENTLYDDATTIFTARSNMTDLSHLVNKCQQMSIKLLYRIQRHHIGRLIFQSKLNPLFQTTYQTSKSEMFNTSESAVPASVSSVIGPFGPNPSKAKPKSRIPSPGTPKTESSMKISINRRDLLNGLNLLNVNNEPKGNLTNESSGNASQLLESLSKLEISSQLSQGNENATRKSEGHPYLYI